MKKRILSLALVLIMALGLLPTATAVDTTYKTWSQGDSRWGNMSMSPSGYGHSMAREGCYVTAIAKLLVHAGQQDPASFTPKNCLEGLLGHGMLSADGGIYYGSFNNSFLPAYGPQLTKETSPNHGAWDKGTAVSTIGGKIRDGYYVIVCVMNKSTGNTHYMAVDYVSDDIYVMDNGGTVPLYGTWSYSGGVVDQVYFKYSGPYDYPAINGPTPSTPPTPSDNDNSGTTKTQYRYHRYEDGFGEYAVCAYFGNSLSTAAGPMHLRYTDWLGSPLPVVKANDQDYLVHPYQGASCANAGCLSSDPYQTYRYRDSAGLIWYYEETRTVAAETTSAPATPAPVTPTPAPATPTPETSSKPTSTTTPEPEVTPSAKPSETVTPPPSEKPSEKPSEPSATPSAEPAQSDEQGTLPLPSTRAFVPDLFWDVKGDDWFYGNVADAYAMGLMNGTGASAFSPRNNMTLAEAVTLAARIHSLYHTGAESFPRYDGGSWYDPYVDYARENRIIDVNYDYTRPATREEFVHILAKALPETELENIAGTVSFADSRDIVYISDVRLLSGAGVINGVPENGQTCFKPNATITRAEVAAVVARMAQPSSRICK